MELGAELPVRVDLVNAVFLHERGDLVRVDAGIGADDQHAPAQIERAQRRFAVAREPEPVIGVGDAVDRKRGQDFGAEDLFVPARGAEGFEVGERERSDHDAAS